ncbi:hypothetical protein CF328_g6828, partial [Tilletia controversa]
YICPKCGAFNSRRPSSVPVSTPTFFTRGSPPNNTSQPRTPSGASTRAGAGVGPTVVEEEEEGQGEPAVKKAGKQGDGDGDDDGVGNDEGAHQDRPGLRQRKGGQEASTDSMQVD